MLKNSEDNGEATGSSENFGEEPSQTVVEPCLDAECASYGERDLATHFTDCVSDGDQDLAPRFSDGADCDTKEARPSRDQIYACLWDLDLPIDFPGRNAKEEGRQHVTFNDRVAVLSTDNISFNNLHDDHHGDIRAPSDITPIVSECSLQTMPVLVELINNMADRIKALENEIKVLIERIADFKPDNKEALTPANDDGKPGPSKPMIQEPNADSVWSDYC